MAEPQTHSHNYQSARFAECGGGVMRFITGPFAAAMAHSDGTGRPLVKFGGFGADLIHFRAGTGVARHTHEGDHILLVLAGDGFVWYDGLDRPLATGLVYLVPGHVPHAIRATTDLTLMAIGNRHVPVDSESRLSVCQESTIPA